MIPRIAAGVAVVAILGAVLWGAYTWAHDRGYREAEAYYKPILEDVRTQAALAEEHAALAEAAAAATNQAIESEDAKRAEDAIRQRDAAVVELRALRVRLSAALGRRCEVPGVSGGTTELAGPPGESGERPERADERLVELGRSCQRDRDRLEAWIDWHRKQSAVAR